MAWKETCSVDERLRFIALVNDSDDTFAGLCEQFGISRKTGYKWVERYEKLGPRGLEERRSVAHTHPHATPTAVLDVLLVDGDQEARESGEERSSPNFFAKFLHRLHRSVMR